MGNFARSRLLHRFRYDELVTSTSRATLRIALTVSFSALAVGTDFAMAPFPNIKVMDTLVFAAAFLFGLRVGIGVGVVSWLVYGSWNPWGPVSMILLFQIIGETFYAVAGTLVRRASFSDLILKRQKQNVTSRKEYLASLPTLGIVGLVSALSYDILTNTADWFFKLYDPSKNLGTVLARSFEVGLLTMNFPLPMGLMHQVSDLFFFALVTPAIVKACSKWV